ncbi:hypothetical protein [Streptomyces pinistramenti]|uniref:hypothetical protein n=1 Tax=Streptomyces pinistramenti TaxID=2884812 RepID=UPI001D06AC96|nr:hypothetical protein [Streptomyces pinistramenti]MCB5911973.1 hypothetical protein [Streptomyces pinistramenti]
MAVHLTRPEKAVLVGTAHGLPLETIARQHAMRVVTVQGYLRLAKGKFGSRDLTDAAVVYRAYLCGILRDSSARAALHHHLASWQITLLELTARGTSPREIAHRSGIPIATVEADLNALCAALGARNAAHLITRTWQLRLLARRRPRPHAALPPGHRTAA